MPSSDPHDFVVDHLPAAQRSLRVAFVTETYPPEVNGVATTTAQVVAGLQRRNHDLQLIRPRQDGTEPAGRDARFHEVLTRGLPIPRYPHLRMGVPSKRALVKLWATNRPDVVHIATEGPLGWSALQAASHLKLPASSDFRTNFHAYSRLYGIGWLQQPIMAYLRKFHNRTACTMVPTDALRCELEQQGFRNLAVVSRGVDTQRFDPARRCPNLRRSLGLAEHDLLMLSVGRLALEKNLATLIESYEAVVKRQPRAKLLIVGDGPLRAELVARCPAAIFAGQRTGDDLAANFASADLFVFPSLTETFGNVTTEAMASGLPVVAFDYAAAAQLIRSGSNGVLVPFGDNASFKASVARLADDQAMRTRLGTQARSSACDLSWDRVVDRFEMVLSTILRRSAAVEIQCQEPVCEPAV